MAKAPAKRYTTRSRPYQTRRRIVQIVSDGEFTPRRQHAQAPTPSNLTPTVQDPAQAESSIFGTPQGSVTRTAPEVVPATILQTPAHGEQVHDGANEQVEGDATVDPQANLIIPAAPTFLRIPAEIRLIIYDQLMADDQHNRSSNALSIRLVNRQINAEATASAFARTVFELDHGRWTYIPSTAMVRVSRLMLLLSDQQRDNVQRIFIDGPGTVLPSLRNLHNNIIRPVEYIIRTREAYATGRGYFHLRHLITAEIREVGHHTANGGRLQRVTFEFPDHHEWNVMEDYLHHFAPTDWYEQYLPAQVLHENPRDRWHELEHNHRVGFRLMPRNPGEGYVEDPEGAQIWQPESVRPLEVYFSRPPRNDGEFSALEWWWIQYGDFDMPPPPTVRRS